MEKKGNTTMKQLLDKVLKYIYQGTFGLGIFFLLDIIFCNVLFPDDKVNMNNMLGGLMCAAYIMGMAAWEMYKGKANQYPLKKNLFAGWIGFLVGALLTGGSAWPGVTLVIAISFLLNKILPGKKEAHE